MDIVTQFPHKVIDYPDMGITLSDNCRLSARVLMPEDAYKNPLPAILEYIPYRKRDGTIERDQLMHKYFAGRGYVVLRVDMRGTGESEGLMFDEYTKEGGSVIVASNEIPELINNCDRIITLQKGKINNTYGFNDFNEHQISLGISSN